MQASGGGNIGVNARNLELSGGELGASFLFAGIASESSSSTAQAGYIALNVTDTITVNRESSIGNRVEESAVGNAGEINIATTNLSLTQGSRVDASTLGQGNAGAITIHALDNIFADGTNRDGRPSGIGSVVAPAAVGNAGKINITTTNLSLTQGGLVTTSTLGQGDAGVIAIEAFETISIDKINEITEFGSGIFSVVSESGTGDSGGIEITTNNLSITQGGVITTVTFGQGNAGAIAIKASETIFIDGLDRESEFGSGIFSILEESGVGDIEGIKIDTNNLSLTNNALISVESFGQGSAGNLLIQANSVNLENGASLFASTPVGMGGNITLQISDNLTLQDNSTISAQALENADGGNIDIDAEFVIAFPNQNNDIIANAAQGIGGNIGISTNSIFGIAEKSSTPINNTNDLDASSEFGLDGTIEINELEVNPAEGLEELPVEIIDVAGLVEQNLCQQAKDSEFIFTGKGGIAPSPTQAREVEVSEVDLVEPASLVENGEVAGRRELSFAPTEVKEAIVEAQGWIINDRGILELVAHKTDLNGSPPRPKDARICNQ